MPTVNPSPFPLWHIAVTAAISLIASIAVLRWRFREVPIAEAALISVVVGLSVLAWRLTGNVAQLNEDPIPPISPNDVLCPVVTYVFLGLYAAFRRPTDPARWDLARAFLTILSFVVNVVFI